MRKGTTLIELVIALGIIITGLLTVVGLIARSIDVGTKSRNEIVALGLAQEGIEAARAIRDSNSLAIEAGDSSVTAWNMSLSALSGAVYDYTGVPVVDYNYTAFPGNVIDGPWKVDFSVNTIADTGAQLMQHGGGGAYDGLFFQDPTVAPNNVTIFSTEYSRLLTLEPICESGQYLTVELDIAEQDLSSADVCPNSQIGVHIISLVSWPAQNGNSETVRLTHDIYDWR